ncbi:MAG: SprT family zinc-dependent metalloprotease [Kyrpidia sp.]|nr:SprT family zinc-dependent metalloprotease [Kyrpidia sp.]
MPTIELDGQSVKYTLFYRPNKHRLTVRVTWDPQVTVSAPQGLPLSVIEEFLHHKSGWILRKLAEFRQLRESMPKKTFSPGDIFYFLGNPYPLKIAEVPETAAGALQLDNDHFFATIPGSWSPEVRRERLSRLFQQWYRRAGYEWALRRIAVYARQLRCFPDKVAVRDQKTRWGSCSSQGAIYLNWRVFIAPLDVVDYVIVHELAHLRHFDHSPDFWRLVESVLPHYADAKTWLRRYGLTLDL